MKGKAFRFEDNVDTDMIIPARWLVTTDPAEMAARAFEEDDGEPEETRRAALAYLVELRSDTRMGQILRRVRAGEQFPAAAASLIGAGGVHALEQVLEADRVLVAAGSHAMGGEVERDARPRSGVDQSCQQVARERIDHGFTFHPGTPQGKGPWYPSGSG